MRQNALLRSGKGLGLQAPPERKTSRCRGCRRRVEDDREDHFAVRKGVRCAGVHLIVDLHGATGLNDIDLIEATLRRCVDRRGGDAAAHPSAPLPAERRVRRGGAGREPHLDPHLAGAGYAALDVFMCGKADPDACIPVLREAFKAKRVEVDEILRGQDGLIRPTDGGGRATLADGGPLPAVCACEDDPMAEKALDSRDAVRRPRLPHDLRGRAVLYEMQTEHQHLVLFEHKFFGKMLMLDGATQVTTKDEFVYHEMMTHVPIFAHGKAEEVLIVGGGDCGIAEEVLKHKSVERLTQVEIDASVVEFSKEHFPEFTKPVLGNKRFDLVIDDGMKYVAKTDRRFDVIIVDSTDPQGPGKVLFSQKFYAACRRCMRPAACWSRRTACRSSKPGELTAGIGQVRKAVRRRLLLRGGDPDLCRRPHGHGLGHRQRQAAPRSVTTIAARYKKAGSFKTKYWTPEVHVAAFALPRFIADI